jgi:hypothetical protein
LINFLFREVAKRMREAHVLANKLTFQVQKRRDDNPTSKPLGMGWCDSFSKSSVFGIATRDDKVISRECMHLFGAMSVEPIDIRGMAISMSKLEGEVGDGTIQQDLKRAFASSPKTKQRQVVDFQKLEDVINELPEAEKTMIRKEHGLRQSNVTLTQMMKAPRKRVMQVSPTKQRDWQSITASQVDLKVFDELPQEVRRELERQLGINNKKPRVQFVQNAEIVKPHVQKYDLEHEQAISMIYNQPDESEVYKLKVYLEALVKNRDLERVLPMMRGMKRSWDCNIYNDVYVSLEAIVQAIYGSRLIV